MAFYNGTWAIYERKEITGDTPLSPQSPTNEIAVSSRDVTVNPRLLATGVLIASTAINVVRSEIASTTGREDIQADVNNVMIGVGLGLAALKGGGLVIGALAIKGAADEIIRRRDIYRTNYANSLESRLRGKRNSIGVNSIYYD